MSHGIDARSLVAAVIVFGLCALIALPVSAQTVMLTPQEQLGKNIFFDKNLSINANQSCAECHSSEAGWTGPDSMINIHGSVYEGSIPGRFGNRKPPSSAYATQSPILSLAKGLFVGGNFWDGRATGETARQSSRRAGAWTVPEPSRSRRLCIRPT
ncbi:MAG: cytochrome-c peroxidase [Chromatiales bacterium]|nr:cytochrome-c peroxidase [Chromatiales bacterium]